MAPRLHWYALAVNARQEKAAATTIEESGIEVFLPVRRERRAWSDRVKNVELALFPGYMFLHVDMSAAVRTNLLKVRQVIELVGRLPGDDRIAQEIPEVEIESLRTLASSSYNLDPTERLVRGSPVLVAEGPLAGVRGMIEKTVPGKQRLVVQIELLGRGVSVQLSASDVVECTT